MGCSVSNFNLGDLIVKNQLCRFRIDDLISHLGLKDARDILNGSKQSDVCKVELQRQWDAWHVDQEQTQRMENGFKD